MGQTGSYTQKACAQPLCRVFTTWGSDQLVSIRLRSEQDFADTFALKKQEFHFLLGKDLLNFYTVKDLFESVFDTDKNKLVDKLEVICAMCLLSSVGSQAKVEYFFETFDFSEKGYLTENEVSLLIRTVTDAAFKIDALLKKPEDDAIRRLVNDAMNFSENNAELRKPDLIGFSATNHAVRAYLEMWSGQSSQVILKPNEMWIDEPFPADYSSIAHSNDWLRLGLPPKTFISWLRQRLISSGTHCLFGHIERPQKMVNRRVVYEGPGACGEGCLVQGLLADRWILNAVAMLIAHPAMLKSLFIPTGQEDQGRYCVRLFEGTSWKSVFVDDLVPVAPDHRPIFSHTSHLQESWLTLLLKAVAKHIGSYGHVAYHSARPDAIDMSLRWFSGGHVLRKHTADFDWNSDEYLVEKGRVGGGAFVGEMLAEGSVIALGRSEAMAFTSDPKSRNRDSAPYGRLLPILAIKHDKANARRVLILRDAWGVHLDPRHGNTDGVAETLDQGTGHCRTYVISLDEVAERFDTIWLCRLPDTTRNQAQTDGLAPWRTEIQSCWSKGPTSAACFSVRVGDLTSAPNVVETGNGNTAQVLTVSSEETNGDSLSANAAPSVDTSAGAADSEAVPSSLMTPVEVLFTVSSSQWSIGAGTSTRVLVVPSDDTRQRYAVYNHHLQQAMELEMSTKKKKKGNKSKKKDNAAEEDESLRTAGTVQQQQQPAGSPALQEANPEPAKDEKVLRKEREKEGEHQFSVPRCWLSFSLHLLPGMYALVVDIGKDEERVTGVGIMSHVVLQATSKGAFEIRPEGDVEGPDKVQTEAGDDASGAGDAGVRRQRKRHRAKASSKRRVKRGESTPQKQVSTPGVDSKPNTRPPTRGSVYGTPTRPHFVHVAGPEFSKWLAKLLTDTDLSKIVPVDCEKWPFMSESQEEAASRGLAEMIGRLKLEADIIKAELVVLEHEQQQEQLQLLTSSAS